MVVGDGSKFEDGFFQTLLAFFVEVAYLSEELFLVDAVFCGKFSRNDHPTI